jgi:hypothetical protein
MTDINNQFWKHTTATTTIDVVVDDGLSIQDSYITNFVSDSQVRVYEKEADGFIAQNDENARDTYDSYKPGRNIPIGGVEMGVVGVIPLSRSLTENGSKNLLSYLQASGSNGRCSSYSEVQTNDDPFVSPSECCCDAGQPITESDIPYRPAPPYDPEQPVQPCGWISASKQCGCYVSRNIIVRCGGISSDRSEYVPLIDTFHRIENDNYPEGYNGPGGITGLVACRQSLKTRQYERSEIDFATGERCEYFITETLFCETIAVIELTRGCDNQQAPFAIDPSEMTPISGGGASGQLVADGNGLVEADILNDVNAAVGCNLAECLNEAFTLPTRLAQAIAVKTNCGCMKSVHDGGDYGIDDYLCEQSVCDWIRGMLRDLGINFQFQCPNTWATDPTRRSRAWQTLYQFIIIILTTYGIGGAGGFEMLTTSDSGNSKSDPNSQAGPICAAWRKLNENFFKKWIDPLKNEDCSGLETDPRDSLPTRPSPECISCIDKLCALTSLPARNPIATMFARASNCVYNFTQDRPNASEEERKLALAQCMKDACLAEYGPGGPPAANCSSGRISCDALFRMFYYGEQPPDCLSVQEPINPATLPNPNTSDAS